MNISPTPVTRRLIHRLIEIPPILPFRGVGQNSQEGCGAGVHRTPRRQHGEEYENLYAGWPSQRGRFHTGAIIESCRQCPTAFASGHHTEPVAARAAEPILSPAAAEQQMSKLVAEMMEGKRPDASFLHQLQKAAGGSAKLLKCLRWMEPQVDHDLGIRKYAFSESDRHLLVATIQSLCRSPHSPF